MCGSTTFILEDINGDEVVSGNGLTVYTSTDGLSYNIEIGLEATTIDDVGEWKYFLKEIDATNTANIHTTEILMDIVSCVSNLTLFQFDDSSAERQSQFDYYIGESDLVVSFEGITNGNCEVEVKAHDESWS